MYCLIDVLVLNAVAKLSGEKVAEVYESMEDLSPRITLESTPGNSVSRLLSGKTIRLIYHLGRFY